MNEVEIIHTKAPIKIWSGLLGVPNDYREKLIETTYDQHKKAPHIGSFYDVFNEKNGKIVATSYKAWNDAPIYSTLVKGIETMSNKWIQNDDWTMNVETVKYEIIEAWAGVYKENQTTNSHNHVLSSFSFCYYMKAEPPYTPMVFDNSEVSINARTDLLIVFPSFIFHSVPPVVNERVFMAGNMVPISSQEE